MKTPGLGLLGWLGWLGATVALALVFAAYQSPHLVVDLASRVWACF